MTPLNFVLLSTSGNEPVSLAEAKAQCRISHNMQDTLITSYIKAARAWVEGHCKISLVTHEWRTSYERVCGPGPYRFELCRPPVTSVDSVQYRGDSSVVAIPDEDFIFDPDATRGEVVITSSAPTLATRNLTAPISINFTTGPGADQVDEVFKLAIKLMVSNFYENETPVTAVNLVEAPLSVRSLLSERRILNPY